MKHVLSIAAAMVALGACNKEPKVDAKDATPAEVAAKVQESGVGEIAVKPGLWKSKVTIGDVNVPGAPPELSASMRGKTSEERTYCLKPEEVKRPNENFFGGNKNECRYDHFTMGGGKVDGAMRCTHEQLTQLVKFNGTYGPEAYALAMNMKVEGGPREMAGMSMSMSVDSKRVGECSAKQG